MSVYWEEHQGEMTFLLPYDYSFTENLSYLSSAKGECLYQIRDQKIYKAFQIGQKTSLIEISYDESHRLRLRFVGNSTPPPQSIREWAARYVIDWFDLLTDLTPFYELAHADEILQLPVHQFHGLRNIGIPDLFEAISWGIIGQQINLTFAYTLKRRFVENFGSYVEFENERYLIFPSSQTIASLSIQDLTPLQFSAKKAEYLIGVAKQIENGALTKEMLQNAGYEDAEKLLTRIHGIGSWTANYVFMRCLRFPMAIPMDDVGLHNALKFAMNTESKPTREQIREIFSKWRGWESYATFYLWRLLY
jgi:DNA-3-methyladenine glycosylase II